MKIARLPFLDALLIIKPALATKDLIEELSHCWFDGKYIMAYNDAELGIQVPLETPFSGGIRGSLLLGLLYNSRAKNIELELGTDGTLQLKAARTHATLSLLEANRSVWKFPTPNKDRAFKLTDAFIVGLEAVLVSVGRDTSIPETLGVTVYLGDEITLYATDSNTIASVVIPYRKGKPTDRKSARFIIPKVFCEQLLRICKDGGFLEFCEDCVLAGNASGVLIYARLIHAPKPLRFNSMVSKYANWSKSCRFPVPNRLSLALDRMGVLFDGLVGETMTVSLGEGTLRLSAEIQGRGQLKDSVVIPDTVPSVTFRTEPYLLKRALNLATHMVCTEDVVRFDGEGNFLYLAAHAVG